MVPPPQQAAGPERIVGMVLSALGPLPKLPQIFAVLKNKSVDGLSHSMFVSEIVCYVVSAFYHWERGYPIHTYGETLALAAENVVILSLFARWQASKLRDATLVAISLGLASVSAALLRWRRSFLSSTLQKMMVAMSVGVQLGRVPQILKIYRTGDSGQLNPIQFASNFCGCSLRLYTTAAGLGADRVLVGGYLLALLFNGTLLGQILACRRHRARLHAGSPQDDAESRPLFRNGQAAREQFSK